MSMDTRGRENHVPILSSPTVTEVIDLTSNLICAKLI